jgi:hypothetical protein
MSSGPAPAAAQMRTLNEASTAGFDSMENPPDNDRRKPQNAGCRLDLVV